MSKTVELISIKVQVKLNLSADHWQLYHIEGRDEVALELNREIELYLADGKIDRLHEVLDRFSKFGASDSEGYRTVEHILELCGIDHYQFI